MTDNLPWYFEGKEHVWYPYTQMSFPMEPIAVVRTEGCRLHLADGRELVDGTASWWSACHGYNHPHIIEAMNAQLHQMPHVMFAGVAHEQAYRLSQRLCKLTHMDKAFLTDSGSTAVETAMKMAVQYWRNLGQKRRNKFITFKHGYHGDTMGCMSLADPESGMHTHFNNYQPKQFCTSIPCDEYSFLEFESLLEGVHKNIAGVIIEPLVQGAGGMRFHSPDVLAEIHRIVKQFDLLFIADEVMTGFGRTGYMFACEEANITPDILCIGKALTGGHITLAATLAQQNIFDAFLGERLDQALMSGPTFMANPLACSAANASLDLFEQEPRLQQVQQIESQLYDQLTPLLRYERVKDVRVKGAIGVVQLHDASWEEIFQLRELFISKGVWIRPFSDIIYLMPPLVISDTELSTLIRAIDELLSEIN